MASKITRKSKAAPTNSGTFRVWAMTIVCGLVLVSGFFIAGRQHFSSMDYGMKNSKLRKQIDDLEAEKRRLILTREMSLTPNELTKVAKKVGLNASGTAEPATLEVAAKTEAKSVETPQQKQLVVKTASVEKVPEPTAAVVTKSDTTSIRNAIKKTIGTE